MIIEDAIIFLRKDPALSAVIDSVGDYKAEAIFKRFKKLYPKFPTASEILSTRKSKLRVVGLSGMKIEYLKDLARHIEEGRLDMRSVSKMGDENVITHLTQVKGIGRWTAEMFLIFSLGRQDVFPVDDLGLRKGVQVLFSLPEIPKPKEVERLGERWKPYRTIATWYIWKSLQKFNKIG